VPVRGNRVGKCAANALLIARWAMRPGGRILQSSDPRIARTMRFVTVRCLAISCALAALSGGSALAANRCVDAKGRTQALSACASADAALPLAAPGTYSTLPERSPPTRGPQAKVYASNPHPATGAQTAVPGGGATQGAVPVVIELNGGPGVVGTGAAAPNPPRTPKRTGTLSKVP
jgi:hypothetical protein